MKATLYEKQRESCNKNSERDAVIVRRCVAPTKQSTSEIASLTSFARNDGSFKHSEMMRRVIFFLQRDKVFETLVRNKRSPCLKII